MYPMVFLGYAVAAFDLALFWKTNRLVWLGLAVLQIFLSGILLALLHVASQS